MIYSADIKMVHIQCSKTGHEGVLDSMQTSHLAIIISGDARNLTMSLPMLKRAPVVCGLAADIVGHDYQSQKSVCESVPA